MIERLRKAFILDWKSNSLLFVLAGLLFLFGLWHLPHSPATWFDEGINLGIVKSLINNGVYSLEIGPGDFVKERQFLITNNYPVLLPVALSLKLFGFNLIAARLPMVLFLLLFSLTAYLLVKKLYSKEAAIMSLALIISFIPFYGNGKNVLGEVPALFYLLCGLLLLSSNFNWKPGSENSVGEAEPRSSRISTSWKRLFLAGIFFGLSAATKPFFLIILPAIFIGEFFGHRKSGIKFWQRILIISAGLLPPLIIWLFTILPKFSLSEISAAVNYYSNSYAATNFGSLIISNFLRFFQETTPLHFLLLLAVVLLVAALKQKKGGSLREEEIILLAFIFINILWYLKTPGWYRYFFPSHLLLFLLFPASLKHLFNRKTAIAVVVGLFLVQGAHLITQRNESLYNSDEAAVFSQWIMGQTESNSKILTINSPSIAFLLNDRQIYQYLQVNPLLFFGKNTLMQENELYPYVVTKGSLVGININDLEKILDSNYEIATQVGHYVLYKKL